MSEKKMVRRNVAVALGIICIILVASLAGTFAYYVNDKNNTISSLTSDIVHLYSNITDLQNEIRDLNDTLKLDKLDPLTGIGPITVTQQAGTYNSWNYSIPYAGYLYISVSPAINDTYFRVLWNTGSKYPIDYVQYDYQTSAYVDHAVFPVLPTQT